MLRARGLSCGFRGAAGPVLRGIDLVVGRGDSLAVMGPSGSGKSTLLRVLAGLVERDAGTIELDGAGLPALRDRGARRGWHRRVLLLPQDTARAFNPARRLDAQFGAAMALHGVGGGARHAEDWAGRCGLPGEMLGRFPAALSGGQLQRAALARLLCLGPDFLLLDEPTSALDPATTHELLDLLGALRRERAFGLVIATHDAAVARQAGGLLRLG